MRRSVVFPNASRSYDATRVAVRFWGYDQSMEIPFFIGAEVLARISQIAVLLPGLLRASNREFQDLHGERRPCLVSPAASDMTALSALA